MNTVEFWKHVQPNDYSASLVMRMKDYSHSQTLVVGADPNRRTHAALGFLRDNGIRVSYGDAFILVDAITGKREAFVLFAHTEFLPVEVR